MEHAASCEKVVVPPLPSRQSLRLHAASQAGNQVNLGIRDEGLPIVRQEPGRNFYRARLGGVAHGNFDELELDAEA